MTDEAAPAAAPKLRRGSDVDPDVEALVDVVLQEAIGTKVQLGTGLLERPYQIVLAHRLRERGLGVEQEVAVPLVVHGAHVDVAYRLDLLVEEALVVEVKSVEELHLRHVLQLKTYLRLGRYPLGLLVNFGSPRIGIRRVVP